MIQRVLESRLRALARKFPVVTVTGPRQSGKTTLCRTVFSEKPYVSLEAPDVQDFARRDPRALLAQHPGGAVLDEVHRVPELLSYIQPAVDAHHAAGRYILAGSGRTSLFSTLSASRSRVARLSWSCCPSRWRKSVVFRCLPPACST